jgi:hypothetical protein
MLRKGIPTPAELHHTAQRDDAHVSKRVSVHVVDEAGRKRDVVDDDVICALSALLSRWRLTLGNTPRPHRRVNEVPCRWR